MDSTHNDVETHERLGVDKGTDQANASLPAFHGSGHESLCRREVNMMAGLGMACIFIGFLLHGCGLYTAFAVDVAIGIAAFLIGTKKESRR